MTNVPGKPTSAATAGGLPGILWIIGWLFTIGFAKLIWWQGMLALLLRPSEVPFRVTWVLSLVRIGNFEL